VHHQLCQLGAIFGLAVSADTILEAALAGYARNEDRDKALLAR